MPSIGLEPTPAIQVAAGVLQDATGQVLLTRRAPEAHQGGLWEFPGGKREPGETLEQALARELDEELGIQVLATEPVISVAHDYGDRRVRLVVRRVIRWRGVPHGREGQPLRWAAPDDLPALPMPAADRPIVAALRLPDRMAITGGDAQDRRGFLGGLEGLLADGVGWVQLRTPGLAAAVWDGLARAALDLCRARGAHLLLNPPAGVSLAGLPAADGLHLNGRRLAALAERPPGWAWVGASCHGPADLARAAALGLDYAFLSPVLPTPSHPGTRPLGWDGFAAWVDDAALPVYALGGVTPGDIPRARALGGQGVAGIRGFRAAGT